MHPGSQPVYGGDLWITTEFYSDKLMRVIGYSHHLGSVIARIAGGRIHTIQTPGYPCFSILLSREVAERFLLFKMLELGLNYPHSYPLHHHHGRSALHTLARTHTLVLSDQ